MEHVIVIQWTNTVILDGEDFVLRENSTVFLAGPGSPNSERKNCFLVDIIDDTHHEGEETFTLTSEHMEQPRVHLQPNVTSITILNDDSK